MGSAHPQEHDESTFSVPRQTTAQQRKEAERKAVIKATIDLLVGQDGQIFQADRVNARLSECTNLPFLKQLFELAKISRQGADQFRNVQDKMFLLSQINALPSKECISRVYANREFLTPDYRMESISIFVGSLDLRYGCMKRVPTLAEHIRVNDVFPHSNDYGWDKGWLRYGQSLTCKVVEEFPHRVDDIIELVKRGVRPEDIRAALLGMDFGASTALRVGAL